MTFNPGFETYTQGFGSAPAGVQFPVYLAAAPTSTSIMGPFGPYQVGQRAIVLNTGEYVLLGFSSSAGAITANWVETASSSGNVLSVAGTANQIVVTPTTGNAVVSLANPLVTPGPATVTGNLTISGAGTGIITTPTVVAAGASPQTANGRVFVVSFSGVSIASGASQTFTITNSAITGSTTDVSLTWYGATAGSGLSIASVTPSGGSLAIVMTNATSATMVTSTANITFVGIVLN